MTIKKRKVPVFKSDKDAEKFLESDLSDVDWSDFKSIQFEITPKKKPIKMKKTH